MADRRDVLRMGVLAAGITAPILGAGPALAGARPGRRDRDRPRSRPLVIGHRGASGYRPEHTLASYELAARMGADFIEPDLVATKDGVLVARHEPEIGGTTDVAARPEFADRRRTVSLDGVSVTGWFTHDFTLAELKTLRAVERLPQVRQRNTLYNGLFEIPTFQEVLDLRARLSTELGRRIGVYPETKHPTYFRDLGLELETPLTRVLRRNRLDHPDAPVFVQSFEARNLQALHDEHRLRVPLIFLTAATGNPFGDPRGYADYLTPAGLRGLAEFVSGIGPDKNQIIPRNPDGTLGTPTGLVADAHRAGLALHPYTFRAENQFLPVDYRVTDDPNAYGRAIDEQITFLRAGIDGLFTDQADIGVLARRLAFAETDNA
ncbi:MAG TPA: glycerophosphodiester phosphodiesterase [Streptosporangiaceae bacterium]|nr:glycerophosphodiester phosphodiesterase [Streptosporangiaceae bacterium]